MHFLQDGDPSQNSSKAQTALQDVGALLFRIPARSPDLNPIENIFNIVSAKMEWDALRKQITHGTFEQFSDRVEKTLRNIDPKLIDRTIEPMNKRIELIVKRRGRRCCIYICFVYILFSFVLFSVPFVYYTYW